MKSTHADCDGVIRETTSRELTDFISGGITDETHKKGKIYYNSDCVIRETLDTEQTKP